jgi:hypothetical protein
MKMEQTLFNIILGVAGVLGGWWMKVMWESLKDLQKADKELTEKVSSVEVLVAGDYVRRSDFDRTIERLFAKLDHIEMKINEKADRE